MLRYKYFFINPFELLGSLSCHLIFFMADNWNRSESSMSELQLQDYREIRQQHALFKEQRRFGRYFLKHHSTYNV